MGFDTKHDVVTMVGNYRNRQCAQEVVELLQIAKTIDLTVLKKILPKIKEEFPHTDTEDKQDTIKKLNALYAFSQTIQNVK